MGWLVDKIREWFCKHEWECLVEEQPIYELDRYGRAREIPSKYQWIYVCKKCKKVKKIHT